MSDTVQTKEKIASSVISKIVLLNGPPRCGKDTAADGLKQKYNSKILRTRFAEAVKVGCHSLLGMYDIDSEAFNSVKDEPQELLGGMTWREFYIAGSENFMKPLFGNDIFGRVLMNVINSKIKKMSYTLSAIPKIAVVSDCGFIEEAAALSKYFNPDDIILIRIHRDGYDFSKDSRSYIRPNWMMHQYDVENPEGYIDYFVRSVQSALALGGALDILQD